MNRKTTRLGCAFVVMFGWLTACSDDQGLAPPQTGTGGGSGSGGSGLSGSAGSGGTDVGSGGTAGTGGATGGIGGGGANPDAGRGACGPLRGEEPTEASVQAQGSFAVMSYTDAPTSSGYRASTIYFPGDAPPPFVGVAAVPGLNGVQRSVSQWGTFLASHGYAVIVIDTNVTSENPSQRSSALMAAITTLKAENTRSDSPLSGKISDCMVIMGHSMGGGGAVIAANANGALLKGAIGLSPYGGGQSASNITVPTLLFVATGDPLSTPNTHVKPAYQTIPEGTSKMYLEFAGGSHDIAQYPINTRTTDAIVARYGLSWLKFNVDGDTRYRQFLNRVTSGLADYQTNLQ
jgi:triacylglycerol lipase